jgi:hypothetical protein
LRGDKTLTTITQKKKKSIWLWVLIILAFSAVIVAVVLHSLGIINLSFIGAGFLSLQQWSAMAATNALILDVGLIFFGIAIYYVLLTYFIGVKTTMNVAQQQGGYAPTPTYPTATPQKDTETVIT